MSWISLNDMATVQGFSLEENPQIIFKHSPRCGISSMILRGFEKSDLFKNQSDDFWLLNVRENRAISDFLAKDLSIQHESPQVLVLWKGVVVYHASHSAIDADKIELAIRQ